MHIRPNKWNIELLRIKSKEVDVNRLMKLAKEYIQATAPKQYTMWTGLFLYFIVH